LAIFTAWRLRGLPGAVVGGLSFIVPGHPGAGPAVIGTIAGSAIPLALSLHHLWQFGALGAAAVWLLAARRGVVSTLLAAAVLGSAAALIEWPAT
jgi:chromate transport protein ChrA